MHTSYIFHFKNILTEYKNNSILHYRKKELIIRKIKKNLIDDKHKDDEEIELEKQYIEDENDDNLNDENTTNQNNCPNLITEIIKMNWTAKEGYDMYMEFPRSTCKDKSVKGIVGCCGVLKFCDKKLNKDKKEKGKDENNSKLALEIEKVKKKQKIKGDNNEN